MEGVPLVEDGLGSIRRSDFDDLCDLEEGAQIALTRAVEPHGTSEIHCGPGMDAIAMSSC